jgi:hypothetical protein
MGDRISETIGGIGVGFLILFAIMVIVYSALHIPQQPCEQTVTGVISPTFTNTQKNQIVTTTDCHGDSIMHIPRTWRVGDTYND